MHALRHDLRKQTLYHQILQRRGYPLQHRQRHLKEDHRRSETEGVGIDPRFAGSLIHPAAYAIVGQQDPIELLIHPLHALAAQRSASAKEVGLGFVVGLLDLPTLMVEVG